MFRSPRSKLADVLFERLLLVLLITALLHECHGAEHRFRTKNSGNRALPMRTDAAACAESSHPSNWVLTNNSAGYRQWLYAAGDFVSNSLLKEGQWESLEADQIEWALTHASQQKQIAGRGSQQIIFLDVGANVGHFTLRFANQGYNVLAFEAMEENAKMVQASLCANPALAERVSLINSGLSSSRGTCYIVSDNNNVGDGTTVCADSRQQAQARVQTGYSIRGSMSIDRLDAVLFSMQHQGHLILHQTTFVMKIDTEGHDFEVMRGSVKVLAEGLVWYIVAEYGLGMLLSAPSGLDGANSYLHLMYGMGYNISRTAFAGPFELPQDIVATAPMNDVITVFMSLRETFRRPQLPANV